MTSLTVTFVEPDGTVRRIADAQVGQSLMEVGKGNGVIGILAECGGACSCATCHVHVADAWVERTGPPNPVESDMLDMAMDARPNSRLSCQIRLAPELDGLVVWVAPC